MNPSFNTSVDDSLKTAAYQKLVESGERDRLTEVLIQRLESCGWKDQLRGYCIKIVKEKGVDNVTIDDLVLQVTPVARKHVPEDVRAELVQKIRAFLSRELK